MKTWFVTGGAGFIGSNFILNQRRKNNARIINFDALTYAGNPENLEELENDPNYTFVHGNLDDRESIRDILKEEHPSAVLHFAAESHVDRSIVGPGAFIQTNRVGTFNLLEEVRAYLGEIDDAAKKAFRFHHISTDEVYGSLMPDDPAFSETTPYDPHSPYSASKASSDHLVNAYHSTYGLPTIITNCSNNYGPYQFPEKLMPLMILNALEGKPLPIYGDGSNIRDWLYVEDHCEAIQLAVEQGVPGETYNIGGSCEKTNLEIVKTICTVLDALFPDSPDRPHESLITFVKDRPGHDLRYAVDTSKIQRELDWQPKETFETGLEKTIKWYITQTKWIESIKTGLYREWIDKNYSQRT